jgi:hypothetical protein
MKIPYIEAYPNPPAPLHPMRSIDRGVTDKTKPAIALFCVSVHGIWH